MSSIHPENLKAAAVNRVSSLATLERFRNEHEVLVALAFLITGSTRNAEGAVSKARELMTNWAIPFTAPEQLTKWVRWVTIKAAVADSLGEIRSYEPRYFNRTCMHAEHLLHGNSKLQQFHDFLVHLNPAMVIGELDPLARAVAMLRTTSRVSILDCALSLKLSVDTVLAVNCRAMSWIAQKRNEAEREQVPPRKTVRKIHGHNYAPVQQWRNTVAQLHVDN
jgi:hypothetical protein